MTQTTEPSRFDSSAVSFLALTIWFGLAGGLCEDGIHLLRRVVRHRFLFLSDDAIWMGPVMDVVLLMMVGGLVWVIQRRRRRPVFDGVIPAFLFVTTLSVLLSYPRLHWVADLVLALGVAYQGSRFLSRRRLAFSQLVRRTLPVLAGLILLMTAGLYARRLAQAHRIAGARPPSGGPNVLLIILDTVRGLDFEGGNALDRLLPRLSRRAARGVRFDLAIASSSWTLPSHASIFTGRWPSEHRANWNSPLDSRYPTLAEVLARRGYATAGFVANKEYLGRESGLARGFQEYQDYIVGPGEFMRSSPLLQLIVQDLYLRRLVGWYDDVGRKSADRINHDVLRWVGKKREGPFFVFLNYFDAHAPYLPPPPFDVPLRTLPGSEGKDPERRFRDTWQRGLPPPPVMEEAKVAYAGALGFLDNRVGMLLDSLEARGILRNTVVILAADHGEEFGEHGAMGHGHNVYRTTVQVPLVIWQPGGPTGRVSTPTSLRNIPTTIMMLVDRAHSPFPGHSLLDARASGDSARSELMWVPGLPPEYGVGDADQVSWVVDSIRSIERIGGKRETFPVGGDPFEGGHRN